MMMMNISFQANEFRHEERLTQLHPIEMKITYSVS